MNRILIACTAALLAMAGPAFAGANGPKVVVRASSAVTGQNITLGDIADITPSPQVCKASARLAATVVGRAPLAGNTRALTHGDICLKLRQAGIDPDTVNLEGASNITVSQLDAAQDQSSASLDAAGAAPAGPVVKPGDELDIVLIDGPVIVRAKAFAITGGSVGQTISVRRDGSPRPLTATIIDAGLAELEE